MQLWTPERDLKIQTKTASGAGGQHVNKTESAVRMTHIPSGVTVECQEDRSQVKNRETAIKKLRKILLDKYIADTSERICKTRRSQIGSANRNEKIRTYNFNQDRVTDHRLSALGPSSDDKVDTMYGLDELFENPTRIDIFIECLKRIERQQTISKIFSELWCGWWWPTHDNIYSLV